MQRLKGFEHPVSPEIIGSGLQHTPDINKHYLAVPFDVNLGDEHLHALWDSVPVVAEEHLSAVRGPLTAIVYPDKIIESHRSAHAVGFGALRTRRSEDSFIKVALKPFDDPKTAIDEARGYLWLGTLSIPTYKPIAIFPAQHGEHFISMTHTQKTLDSLDRDQWIQGSRITSAEDLEIYERNERTVKDIAKTMALVHSHGGFLPDGQIKNWAVTPGGKIGAIDTENFHVMELGDERSVESAWADIEKLIKSLVLTNEDDEGIFGVGMFAGMSLSNVHNSVERLFIEPYADQLGEIGQAADAALNAQCEMLYSGVLEKFYKDDYWLQALVEAQAKHRPLSPAGV